ncbi:adenylate cyclase type 3-like, partial [Clarias magur]
MKEKSITTLSLRFVDSELESRYSAEKERQTGVAFSCSCIVLLFTSAMEILIDPQLTVNYLTLVVGEVLLLILTICSLAAIFPRLFSEKLVLFSMWIDRTRWARNTWAMAAIFVLAMAEVADMIEVHDQKERVYEMRTYNEALVTNMLPEHVAKHFLGSKKRDEAYEEIGVMFASIPNFSDFYTEESINNGGIECLRILNEIISDFDSLLDRTEFLCITKIKTIGSTYMAASGLTPESNTNGYSSRK